MAYFAVLNNDNIVTNIIVSDSLGIAEELTSATCVEFDPTLGICGINSVWDGYQFSKVENELPLDAAPAATE